MIKKNKYSIIVPSMHGPWYPTFTIICEEWYDGDKLVFKKIGNTFLMRLL